SPDLAADVQELVRSLGGRVAVNVKANVMYTSPSQVEPKAARVAYRVQNIRLPEINAFSLPRKAALWKDRTGGFGNHVVSIEYVRHDLVQCILVADERHLYLTDDFIPTHNTSNIVFLKSTDDTMIETLEKMSGKRHRTYRKSKQVTQNLDQIINKTDGRVIYTMETIEEPVISYNDMAFIPPNNSVVFRAGDAPVWNRNETIMPMMWKLGDNKIVHPGHDYSLQTVPTLSSALDFDVRRNQPNFIAMFDKRLAQAVCAGDAKMLYGSAHGYTSFDIERLDPDVYADEVMEIIGSMTAEESGHDPAEPTILDADDYAARMCSGPDAFVENIAVANEVAERSARQARMDRPLYAEGLISPAMLIRPDGTAKTGALAKEISEAYR
ncbi:MAG: hypothetical protein ACRDTJ_32970, partial [Pseudonocardiaceae bacterium]